MTMNDGTQDQVTVSFPAGPAFSQVGRVAVAGLALRLGIDLAIVERLRLAVDRSIQALSGDGRVRLDAQWEPHRIVITLSNPDGPMDPTERATLHDELAAMVSSVTVDATSVELTVAGATNGHGPN